MIFERRISMALPLRSTCEFPLLMPGLEDVCVEGAGGVAAGLGFLMAARWEGAARGKTVVLAAPLSWLNERGRLLAGSLAAFGLAADAMLVVAPRTEAEALWAMEEALRSGTVSLAIGAVETASLLATRRLDRAARTAGTAVVLLKTRPARDLSAARRRWRVGPHPSAPHPWDAKASGAPRWRVTQERSRDGSCGAWILEQDPETYRLRVADRLADHGLDLGEERGLRRSA